MEFWGIEVKPGNSFPVKPNANKFLHLSQATLGESKKDKGNDAVTIFLKIGNQKLVLGILSHDKFPQIAFDLVFEKDFELSHNSKGGSVYFCGYQSFGMSDELSDLNTESEDEEDDILLENGDSLPKVEKPDSAITKPNAIKPESSGKPKVKIVEPSKDDDSSDDVDDDDSVGESDDDMLGADSDEDDDESDEDEEETPKKADQGKKRSNESIKQTPVPSKKAKAATTSGKTDSKKSGHTDTPHPAKKGIGKTGSGSGSGPAKIETPKTGGQHTCNSCSRSFGSEMALRSHNQAKHGAAK